MPPITPEWWNVNEDAQIWSGHADNHKQFVLEAPAGILAIDEYQGSFQFETAMVKDGDVLKEIHPKGDPGYEQLWIRIDAVTKDLYEEEPGPDDDGNDPPPEDEPDPDDEPVNDTDERIGNAIRILREAGAKVTLKFGE